MIYKVIQFSSELLYFIQSSRFLYLKYIYQIVLIATKSNDSTVLKIYLNFQHYMIP